MQENKNEKEKKRQNLFSLPNYQKNNYTHSHTPTHLAYLLGTLPLSPYIGSGPRKWREEEEEEEGGAARIPFLYIQVPTYCTPFIGLFFPCGHRHTSPIFPYFFHIFPSFLFPSIFPLYHYQFIPNYCSLPRPPLPPLPPLPPRPIISKSPPTRRLTIFPFLIFLARSTAY
ncbi:uncharacterized protein BO66DRAFT_108203 [Aspergillus aculeatinus CBS 121060]|uniref:Uncharacterized protein n=1 Tax=Aspergillus aculeatinus CBS 121060 TaxID=1448322 RepID=A0ACD1HM94_9EURO|nr:hypothetical protein BO66DRAFT_108203 [Aspergillus aculeatinus CBS 121060]RAH74473.1 hypothetical protein BO66DRAFT_108203 [Aspergillus aculeatinus CBS 121060]